MRVRIVGRPGRTQLLCAFFHEGGRIRAKPGPDAVAEAYADMGGRLCETAVVHTAGPTRRIMVVGLGKKDEVTADTVRLAAGAAAKEAARLRLAEFTVAPPEGAAAQAVEGAVMALYRFDRFKSERKKAPGTMTVVASGPDAAAVSGGLVAARGAMFARDIANMPPNECAPATLASIAKKVGGPRVRCRVMSGAELSRRGFGGITAVGGGSKNPPRLIILEYMGGAKSKRPVALVGKAVTFDTGGISIKPRDRMEEMKFDKCGGCTVLGIVKAAAEMRLRENIVGVIPAAENMPGGGAYRPGDIIRLYGGRTAEILNTDAEGRLILADALAYAEAKYSPRVMIDFATLTGACIVALGSNVAGLVSNDDRLAGSIVAASERTAEEVWRLPLNRDYMEMVKSDVADVKNMGTGTAAGAIAAAAFLRGAIGDTPWAHIDIAGVAWTQPASKKKAYNPKGATGFGVRLALDYLQNI